MNDVKELEPVVAGPPNREDVEARIEALRRTRGASVLDGAAFDETALRAAEAELEALDDADGEARRRASKAIDDAQVSQRAADAKALNKASAAWLAQIDEAEAMARAMTAALREAEKHRAEVQRLASALTGSVPLIATASVQEDRRSRALCALLAEMTGRTVFGDVQFMTLTAAGDAWGDVERAAIAVLKQQLKGDGNG